MHSIFFNGYYMFLFCLGISRETIALLPNHKSKCAHHASHMRNQGHSGNLFQKAHMYPETWTKWTYPVRAQCILLLMQILFHLQWLSEFMLHQMLTDLILAMKKNHLVFLSCCGCSSNSDLSGGLFMSGRRAI